jgi:hypothetical protein
MTESYKLPASYGQVANPATRSHMINTRATFSHGEFPFMSASASYGRSHSLGGAKRGTLCLTKKRIFFERRSGFVSAMTLTPVSLKIEEIASMSTERESSSTNTGNRKRGKLVILTSNNQKFEFHFSKADPESWVTKIGELKTSTSPVPTVEVAPETLRKFEALTAFGIALIESQIAVKGWIVSTNLSTIKEVDEKVEAAWARLNEASDYFESADYGTMEDGCLNQKRVVAHWAFGDQLDPVRDVDQLDRVFNVANDRLGEILWTLRLGLSAAGLDAQISQPRVERNASDHS